MTDELALRAARHAALGDPMRLAIVDQLAASDRAQVTACDRAYEDLDAPEGWLHWSVPDPVPLGTKAGFDAAVAELRDRITSTTGAQVAA